MSLEVGKVEFIGVMRVELEKVEFFMSVYDSKF